MLASARQLVLLILLLGPLSWGMTLAQTSQRLVQEEPEVSYSCEEIGKVPADQRCSFVMAECAAESRLPYTKWYYCSAAPHGWMTKTLFVMFLLVLLPLLFAALGNTAELYFSPTMAIVAQTIPGMRPRFAGVTFVAVGNGAPDLSANISALRTGQVALSAGAFTGAAMFVQCVVASEVIRISGGVRCRGATLRDVGVYAACVTGVGLALHSGRVTRWFVAGAALTYLVYALWVFLGDEWHVRGRPELRPGLGMSWKELRGVLLERQYRRKHQGTEPAPPIPSYSGLPVSGADDGLTESLLPWALIEDSSIPTPAGTNHHTYLQPPPVTAARNGEQQDGAPVAFQFASANATSGVSGSVTLAPGGVTRTADPKGAEGRFLDQTPQQTPLHPFVAMPDFTHTGPSSPAPGSPGSGDGLSALSGSGGGPGLAHDAEPQSGLRNRSTASAPVHSTPRGAGSGVLGARTYRQAVWADLAYEPTARGRRQLAVELGGTTGRSLEPQGSGFLPTHVHTRTSPPVLQEAEYAPPQGALSPEGSRQSPVPHAGGEEGQPKLWTRPWWTKQWNSICEELTFGSSDEWASLPTWRRRLHEISFAMLLPVFAALRLSVPMADPETYSQQWLVASMLCSPLVVVAYFGWLNVGAVVAAMVTGAVLAGLVHALTYAEMDLPALDCGTSFSFGPALVSLAGFVMGVMWIDTLASEVVGVISLASQLLRLPPSLVGLTLLAWGSSLGDFFGNRAMARRGASSTALTACFAAPLFNMLLSMALGFSAYFHKEGVTSAVVMLPPDAALGCVALVTYNAILAIVGWANNFFLPARFYLFARAWYCAYLVAAAILALTMSA